MPLWVDPSLHRLRCRPSLVEVSCVVTVLFISELQTEVFAPEAHICSRCGWDKGPGLGVQSLPSGSSFLEISLSLLRFIFLLQMNFGLTRSPAAPIPSQLGLRRAGKGRQAPCEPQVQLEGVWYLVPNKGLRDSFFSLPSVSKPGKTEPPHTVDATYSSSQWAQSKQTALHLRHLHSGGEDETPQAPAPGPSSAQDKLDFFPPCIYCPRGWQPPPPPQPLSQAVPLYKLRSYVCRIGRALVGGEEK